MLRNSLSDAAPYTRGANLWPTEQVSLAGVFSSVSTGWMETACKKVAGIKKFGTEHIKKNLSFSFSWKITSDITRSTFPHSNSRLAPSTAAPLNGTSAGLVCPDSPPSGLHACFPCWQWLWPIAYKAPGLLTLDTTPLLHIPFWPWLSQMNQVWLSWYQVHLLLLD